MIGTIEVNLPIIYSSGQMHFYYERKEIYASKLYLTRFLINSHHLDKFLDIWAFITEDIH